MKSLPACLIILGCLSCLVYCGSSHQRVQDETLIREMEFLDEIPVDSCALDSIEIMLSDGVESYPQSLQNEIPFWETDAFWDAPMNSCALDSIKIGRTHILSDCGEPYPEDIYKMCIYRYGAPKGRYKIDSLLGTWHGYGHYYDPREILTLRRDGTYSVIVEDALDVDENFVMQYQYDHEYHGRYTYDETQNKLTWLNVNSYENLTRSDFLKYENPLNNEELVYSLQNDTMMLFDGADCWPYYKIR